jgi:segregation and condensation protein A
MDSIVELKTVSVEQVEQTEDKFNLNIDNYEGPLELLLDLAKSQKVDLMKISIVQLADEYLKFINNIKKNLELAADFLDYYYLMILRMIFQLFKWLKNLNCN